MAKWGNYLKHEIWNIRITELPKRRALWIRFLRVFMLVLQGFSKKQVQQGAASLTYYSLLATVPIIACLFGVARGLRLQEPLVHWLEKNFGGSATAVQKILEFSQKALENAHQGTVAMIAVLVALWAGIKILIYLELSMNRIWGVKRGRRLTKRFSDYLALLFFCPLLIILSSVFTIFISSLFSDIGKASELFIFFGPLRTILFNLIPILITWLLLTFIYIFIPNTYVRFLPALYAGIIIGTLYQLVQWLYVYLQVGVAHYNAVYGTFAALPLFLVWVHISWIFVLIGGKLSFAFQNITAHDVTDIEVEISPKCLNLLSLRIAHLCVREYCAEQPPSNLKELSNTLQISLPLTRILINRLVEANVLVPLSMEKRGDVGYMPGIPPADLTIKRVIDMIENQGETVTIPADDDLKILLACLEDFNTAMEQAEHNILLKDF